MTVENTNRRSPRPSIQIGSALQIDENYGGLGAHYLNALQENNMKINQIDTVTSITETNGSVSSRALHIAGELKRIGISDNDIILICSRCHADQTVTVLGGLLLGCIIAPIPTEFSHSECLNIVKKLKPKVCFCDLRALKQLDRVIHELGFKAHMIQYGEPKQGVLSFQKLLLNKPIDFKFIIIDQPRKKAAFIMPTQGSTGSPKLVCLSHHFIYSQTVILLNSIKKPEKFLSFYPLCWILQIVLMCLSFEQPMVRILSGAFAERNACKLIHDLKIDYLFISTDLAIKLVEHVAVRDFNLSCLKYMFIGGTSGNPAEVKQLVHRLPKVRFIPIYCTTETGIVSTCSGTDDYEESIDRLGTVGKIVCNAKFKIVDIETRANLSSETYGELLVGADTLMLGYLKNSALTKESMEQDYFKTGDMARFDGSGWVYLDEKITDLLLTPQGKLSSRELESVIILHPYVKEAAVIGNGKDIIACIVLKQQMKLEDEKLITFISQRLPQEKWPSKIVHIDALPITAIGKIKKETLRNNYLRVNIQKSDSFDYLATTDE